MPDDVRPPEDFQEFPHTPDAPIVATYKSASIESMLTAITGKNRVATISAGECMQCDAKGITRSSFRNPVSIKEYAISGLCQQCQDRVFSEG